MSCNLHFGDSTAHATVEWFLKSLTEEGWIPSEELCKELNVVRFVDCMREQVEENRDLFQSIEDIAAKELEEERHKVFPHFSILLFSIARNFLVNLSKNDLAFVKKTSLYRVAEEIYEHFKEQPDSYESCESRSHVFKTGFQLAYFQEDDKWHRKYAIFKDQHYNELRELRLHYYSISENNLIDFSHRFVERLKWTGDPQEFDEYEEAFQELNPLRMELPIPARSTKASEFAEDFIQSLEDDKSDEVDEESIDTKLAKEFRIVQWEVLLRNLVEEDRESENGERKLSFYPVTVNYGKPGMPDEEFLDAFTNKTREAQFLFISSHGEIPTKKRSDSPQRDPEIEENVIDEVRKCRKSFRTLLPQIPIDYPFVHKDLVSSFEKRDTGQASNIILVEDGEFSFFSLLWFLRHATAKGEEPTKHWGSDPHFDSTQDDEALVTDKALPESDRDFNPEEKLTVRFRPDKNNSSEGWSERDHDMYQFAEECGWIILLPESKCVPTVRWQSLITWLRLHNNNLSSLKNMSTYKPALTKLIEHLPVKKLNYSRVDEKDFIKKLWEFFSSEDLSKILNNLKVPGTSMDRVDFAKNELGRLVKGLGSLLAVESSAGLKDRVLLRCSRGFIPLEHLFRAYQPCELHVLLQALNWEKRSDAEKNPTPISIGGATIAGRVESPQSDTTTFSNWVVPYRSLFSTLSAGITLPAIQESSEQMGIQTGERTQKQHFAHQTSNLLDTIWGDEKRNELKFESKFALWMIRTQVTNIWGGFAINTKLKIYDDDDFRGLDNWAGGDWRYLNNREIVTELVYLGLQGGIKRALESNTPSIRRNVRQKIYKHLQSAGDNPERVKEILKGTLDSLSFSLPEDICPPEWVNTKAFAICFYHGVRQAAYHALETYVQSRGEEVEPEKRCLWIEWSDTDQCVFIYNRGEVDKKTHLHPRRKPPKDREFFDLFVKSANAYSHMHRINEIFKIDGPEPANLDDEWQLVIGKGKSDEFKV